MREWILSASWMILVVLGIRYLVKNHISMRLRYGLWLLVLLRLLIPVNLFESPISIQAVLDEPSVSQVGDLLIQLPETIPAWTDVPVSPGTPVLTAAQVLMGLWLIGAAAMAVAMVGSGLHFAADLRRDRREIVDCISPVPVYVSERVEMPCLVGLWKPVIYVTPETASQPALAHVLAHELTHLRHFDHVFSHLRCLALVIHWFNPLVWVAVRVSVVDGELACDEGAIAWLGDKARVDYGRTLIELTCKPRKGGYPMLTATNMASAKHTLRTRIRGVAAKQKSAAPAVALMILLSLFAVGCAFTDLPEGSEPVSQDMTAEEHAAWYYAAQATEEERALLSILPLWREKRYHGDTWTADEEPQIVEYPLYGQAVKHKLDYKHAYDAVDVQITDVVKLVDLNSNREDSLEFYRITYDIVLEDGHETEYFYFRWRGHVGDDDGIGGYSWTDSLMGDACDFRLPDGSMP